MDVVYQQCVFRVVARALSEQNSIQSVAVERMDRSCHKTVQRNGNFGPFAGRNILRDGEWMSEVLGCIVQRDAGPGVRLQTFRRVAPESELAAWKENFAIAEFVQDDGYCPAALRN